MKNTWLKHINMKSLKFIYNLKNISINHMEQVVCFRFHCSAVQLHKLLYVSDNESLQCVNVFHRLFCAHPKYTHYIMQLCERLKHIRQLIRHIFSKNMWKTTTIVKMVLANDAMVSFFRRASANADLSSFPHLDG